MPVASEDFADLQNKDEQIKNVLVVIRSAADQNSCLALNAAVEAPRAIESDEGILEVSRVARRAEESVSDHK